MVFILICSGCCDCGRNQAAAVRSRYPEFIARTTEFYQISLDFWENMDRVSKRNQLKLFDTYAPDLIGQAQYVRRQKILEEGYAAWFKIFPEIRKRSDPQRDALFYYAYRDPENPEKSNQGVLIVRDGKIRDKIILNGVGAWYAPQN
jgi:hypothetical protein